MSKMLTKKEAADLLKVSTRTVNRMVAAKKLKVFKYKNVFRVSEAELARFQSKYTH